MILACPACATRFRVAEAEFEGAAGRTVRCANCGHVWHANSTAPESGGAGAVVSAASPAAAAPPADAAPPGAEPVPESAPAAADPVRETVPPAAGPPRDTAPHFPRIAAPLRVPLDPPRQKRRGWAALSWVLAIAVLLLVVAVAGVLVRRQLAAVWPSAARLAVLAGHPAAAPASGLVIRNIKPARTAEGLRIDGEIADTGSEPRDVPRLRVVLQNAAEKEVQSEIVDPPKARLQPGETVAFQTSFAHPPDAATGVVVTFAAP